MEIFGYLVKYFDHTREETRGMYGLVAAESMSCATAKVFDEFETDSEVFTVEEISIHNLRTDTDGLLDKYDIEYFVNAAKANGYDDEVVE